MKPWERFQPQAPTAPQPEGPWTKFQQAPTIQAPETTQPDGPMQAITEFGRGFNRMLAEVADNAGNLPDALAEMAGLATRESAGLDRNVVKNTFKKYGITTDKVDSFADDLGENVFKSAMMFTALMSMAPAGVGALGSGVVPTTVREMSKSLLANPATAAATDLGATIGGTAAPRMLDPDSPEWQKNLASILGSLAGSGAGMSRVAGTTGKLLGAATGGAVGGTVGGAGFGLPGVIGGLGAGVRTGWTLGRKAAEQFSRLGLPMPKGPLTPKAMPQDAVSYAAEVLEGDKLRINNSIKKAVLNARAQSDPVAAAERLQSEIKASYKAARAKETNLWNRVDQTLPVQTKPLKRLRLEMIKSTSPFEAREALPARTLGKLFRLPRVATTKDLLAVRRTILGELRDERITNDVYKRNLNLIQDAILSEIRKQHPGNKTLVDAQAYSKWMHDVFTRGPGGKLIGRRAAQDIASGQDPLKLAETMIRHSQSGAQLADAAKVLNRPQLEETATQMIRSRFEELANAEAKGSPEAARRYLNKPEIQNFLAAFPKVDADMKIVSADLKTALDEWQTLNTSAFKRFAEVDPQSAINQLWNSTTKVKDAEDIVRRIGANGSADPEGLRDAMSSLQSGMLTKFFERTLSDPLQARGMLANRDTRQMMNAILTPDQMTRLQRIVKASSDFAESSGPGMTRRGVNTLFSRLIGAQTVKSIMGWIGSKSPTIQSTGAGASMAESVQSALLGDTPAALLMMRAVVDPKMERVLYSKVPETVAEFQRVPEMIRAVIGGLVSTNSLILNGEDDEDALD